MEKEYGIRIFFKEGDFDDFDPIKETEHGFDDSKDIFWVDNGNRFEYGADTVSRVVPYEITQNKGSDGIYIRIFDDESALRHLSDITGYNQ